jgi:predicted nucleic acid-binding protein
MTVFLDTDVLIDCLRGLPTAKDWLRSHSKEQFQIPGIVAMELVAGCLDGDDLRRTSEFLRPLDLAWPEPYEFALAYELLAHHWLSSSLGIPDCLIAAMAMSRSTRLYTFNQKHFRFIEGLDFQQPYEKH